MQQKVVAPVGVAAPTGCPPPDAQLPPNGAGGLSSCTWFGTPLFAIDPVHVAGGVRSFVFELQASSKKTTFSCVHAMPAGAAHVQSVQERASLGAPA
jgi:hypothetical protein